MRFDELERIPSLLVGYEPPNLLWGHQDFEDEDDDRPQVVLWAQSLLERVFRKPMIRVVHDGQRLGGPLLAVEGHVLYAEEEHFG